MRIVHCLLLVLTLTFVACSGDATEADATSSDPAAAGQPTASGDGTAYGEPIGDAPLVALGELVSNPAAYEGQRVRVEGLVTDVCAKRGCWMNIGAEEGPDHVQFKVTDGVIVFPMDAKGGHAVAEGTVTLMDMDLEGTREFLAHKAEEAGEAFDPSTVTEPMAMVRLDGHGAVIRSPE
ncbi:MAG: DUF4920 domain-containing protein [Planctomycetota bacterium]|jgi:hypothetical protein